MVVVNFKTKDPLTTSCFLKWGLSHSLGYSVYIHFFKWIRWNFLMIVVLKNLIFGQWFLLSLWSHYVFAYKFSNIVQTLIASWLAKSMKFWNLPPTTLEFQEPHPLKLKLEIYKKTKFGKAFYPKTYRPKTFIQKLVPFSPFSHKPFWHWTNLTHLPMDPLMM